MTEKERVELDNSNIIESIALTELTGWMPRLEEDKTIRKVLKGCDFYALRYYAMHINLLSNESFEEIDDKASFQDDMLYLNDFEGYAIDDTFNLSCLFLSKYNHCYACIENKLTDTYYNYLLD